MISTRDSSAAPGVVLTTHKRHVWLLRLTARGLLSVLSGGSCWLLPGIVAPGEANAADLVRPARWWRDEAARGIKELEAALGD